MLAVTSKKGVIKRRSAHSANYRVVTKNDSSVRAVKRAADDAMVARRAAVRDEYPGSLYLMSKSVHPAAYTSMALERTSYGISLVNPSSREPVAVPSVVIPLWQRLPPVGYLPISVRLSNYK